MSRSCFLARSHVPHFSVEEMDRIFVLSLPNPGCSSRRDGRGARRAIVQSRQTGPILVSRGYPNPGSFVPEALREAESPVKSDNLR